MSFYVLTFCDPVAGEPDVATVEVFSTFGEAERAAYEVYNREEGHRVKMLVVREEYGVKTDTVLTIGG